MKSKMENETKSMFVPGTENRVELKISNPSRACQVCNAPCAKLQQQNTHTHCCEPASTCRAPTEKITNLQLLFSKVH